MSNKQGTNQTVDTYAQELERISKICQFRGVTAEENRQEYIRDAFINGLTSQTIRQRLLENNDLSLDAAKQKARALEQAQKRAESYGMNTGMDTVAALEDNSQQDHLAATRKPVNSKRYESANYRHYDSCGFCGKDRHMCANCPAKDSECRTCGKKVHWQQVCRSRSQVSAMVNENPHSSPD